MTSKLHKGPVVEHLGPPHISYPYPPQSVDVINLQHLGWGVGSSLELLVTAKCNGFMNI